MDGVDAVGEEDEPGLVESSRTLPRLERVECRGDDEEEGEEQSSDEAFINSRTHENTNISLEMMFSGGWLEYQPQNVDTNLVMIV